MNSESERVNETVQGDHGEGTMELDLLISDLSHTKSSSKHPPAQSCCLQLIQHHMSPGDTFRGYEKYSLVLMMTQLLYLEEQ